MKLLFSNRPTIWFTTILLASLSSPCMADLRITPHANPRINTKRICRNLPGYRNFNSAFKLNDCYFGCVNSMPESLFSKISSKGSETIKSIWWWNPLNPKMPAYSWDTISGVHFLATQKVSSLPWLLNWLRTSQDHELELHVLGNDIGEIAFEIETFIMPIWNMAEFSGRPKYSILARFGRTSWARLILSDEDSRVLLTSVSSPDPNATHLLDRTDVYWHPKGELNESSSKFAIIHPDGRIEIITYLAKTP